MAILVIPWVNDYLLMLSTGLNSPEGLLQPYFTPMGHLDSGRPLTLYGIQLSIIERT